MITRINLEPLDDVQLFVKSEDGNQITYNPVSFEDVQDRIVFCRTNQKFSSIYTLLIRSSTLPQVRYYPVPKLLDGTSIPWFALDAHNRLITALASPAKVATKKPSSLGRLLRWPSFLSRNK